MTHKAFRQRQGEMDGNGFMTSIVRIGSGSKRKYEVVVNGSLKKGYKTRRSAKNFLLKIFYERLTATSI
jgi:hypothetical protein